MTSNAICDQCNKNIKKGNGYAFYSTASTGMLGMAMETGNILLCEKCTNEIVSTEGYRKYSKSASTVQSFDMEDVISGKSKFSDLYNAYGDAIAVSVVTLCKAHCFTPEQAKAKAREFAILWWKDNQKGASECAKFWQSAFTITQLQKTRAKINKEDKKELRQKLIDSVVQLRGAMHGSEYGNLPSVDTFAAWSIQLWKLSNKKIGKISENKQELKEYLSDNLTLKDVEKDVIFVGSSGTGCFIATACYGSIYSNHVQLLIYFRDNCLSKSKIGKLFIDFYYLISPPIAKFIQNHYHLRYFIRTFLLLPIIKILKICMPKMANNSIITKY